MSHAAPTCSPKASSDYFGLASCGSIGKSHCKLEDVIPVCQSEGLNSTCRAVSDARLAAHTGAQPSRIVAGGNGTSSLGDSPIDLDSRKARLHPPVTRAQASSEPDWQQ